MSSVAVAFRVWMLVCAGCLCGCAVHPPTIAHVHIGHAVTGVHVTPQHKGYLEVAEQRGNEALAFAQSAAEDAGLTQMKAHIASAVSATDSQETFGLKQSLTMAANHITFAATSEDASANVVRSAPVFASNIAAVIGRCDYIDLLGKDVAASGSLREASLSAAEILKLARANLVGDDSNEDGIIGSVPAEFGLVQLRAELQAMISRENPPYRTVDEWYLFNLVRLPNGRWVFDKLGRGGNIDGYK
jgi:hypothetical protein